jgi:hypothetical protein
MISISENAHSIYICMSRMNVLSLILQLNMNKMDMIKVENDVDIQSEEDYVGTKTDDVYIPSTVSIENPEPEVSIVLK